MDRLLPAEVLARARALRSDQSKPEEVMWAILRDRRFCGLKFRRQHPLGPYFADFFCSELSWVVEVDGGQHNTNEARRYDEKRAEYLQVLGLTLTRFWNNEVMAELDSVFFKMQDVAAALRSRKQAGTLTPALSQRKRGRKPSRFTGERKE